MEEMVLGKFPPIKLPPGIFPPISLIVYTSSINGAGGENVHVHPPRTKTLVCPERLNVTT